MFSFYLKQSLTQQVEPRLVSLLEFYDVQGYQYWGQTEYDPTDDSSDDSDISLEDAVEAHPGIAIDELASILGLPIGDIRSFHERAARHRRQQQERISAAKRRAATDAPMGETTKRARESPPAPNNLPMNELLLSSSKSSRSEPEKLGWDVSANERAIKELFGTNRARQSRSPELSLTDIISSQEPRYLGTKRG